MSEKFQRRHAPTSGWIAFIFIETEIRATGRCQRQFGARTTANGQKNEIYRLPFNGHHSIDSHCRFPIIKCVRMSARKRETICRTMDFTFWPNATRKYYYELSPKMCILRNVWPCEMFCVPRPPLKWRYLPNCLRFCKCRTQHKIKQIQQHVDDAQHIWNAFISLVHGFTSQFFLFLNFRRLFSLADMNVRNMIHSDVPRIK